MDFSRENLLKLLDEKEKNIKVNLHSRDYKQGQIELIKELKFIVSVVWEE